MHLHCASSRLALHSVVLFATTSSRAHDFTSQLCGTSRSLSGPRPISGRTEQRPPNCRGKRRAPVQFCVGSGTMLAVENRTCSSGLPDGQLATGRSVSVDFDGSSAAHTVSVDQQDTAARTTTAEPRRHSEGQPPDGAAASRARLAGLPDVEDWQDRPVLFRPEPGCGMRLLGEPDGPIRPGAVHRFETDIFEGAIVLRVQFGPGNASRKMQHLVQGRFKKEVLYKDLRAGFELGRPLETAPPGWLVGGIQAVVSRFSPFYQLAGPKEPRPGFTGLMVGLAQSVHVAEPGEEPDILGHPQEDTSCLGEDRLPSAFAERKQFLSRPGPWEEQHFDTGKVWTFGFWQDHFSITNFSVDAGFLGTLPVASFLQGQPLVLVARAGEEPLYNFEMWNETMLQ